MVVKSGIAFLATYLLVVTPTLAQERPKGRPAASAIDDYGAISTGGGRHKPPTRYFPLDRHLRQCQISGSSGTGEGSCT